MFSKVLIANRGEIACRVMRSCQAMGIRTVAVYSDVDKNALHVEMADEAVCIGGASAAESYLVIDKIMAAAKDTGAEAIHPGYGFLSENAKFADACEKAGIAFVGPKASSIRAMGSKSEAKALMEKAGVPLVPGYHGDDQSPKLLAKEADRIGYPLLIKASAGGGGKGMRVVESADEFKAGLEAAKREAKASFDDDHVLIEKYITQPRHIEFQICADTHSNTVHLFERDCSIQRRHQKVIEEAPAPNFSDELRQKMGEAAVKAAEAIDYVGAGTVEFLLDADGSFYFMEMNTRLQVEHPVTEMITGVDLVQWQLMVANGGKLPLKQSDLSINGHAVEMRLYAEDPANEFLPAAGTVTHLSYPREGASLRVETALRQVHGGRGEEVSIYYDPMIAKIIAHGLDRSAAIDGLINALSQTRVLGIPTNIGFVGDVLRHDVFKGGTHTTRFIETYEDGLLDIGEDNCMRAAAYAAAGVMAAGHVQQKFRGWRQTGHTAERFTFTIGDNEYDISIALRAGFQDITVNDASFSGFDFAASGTDGVFVASMAGETHTCAIAMKDGGQTISLSFGGAQYTLSYNNPLAAAVDEGAADGRLTAPMPGKVVTVLVNAGDSVVKGTPLLILEAMKMEHTIKAPHDGVIEAIHAENGDQVDERLELVSLSAG